MKRFIKKNFNVIFSVISAAILAFAVTVVCVNLEGNKNVAPEPDWETLYDEQNYGAVKELKRSFTEDEIFDKTMGEKYYVYFYSPTCAHCNEIKTDIVAYATAENCKTVYFVDTSKNRVPTVGTPDDSKITEFVDDGTTYYLIDLNDDGIYSKTFSAYYTIAVKETDETYKVDEKVVVFATTADAQKYMSENELSTDTYKIVSNPFEKDKYFGYTTEYFSSYGSAQTALQLKDALSIVGKTTFEEIKIYGTPTLISITPTFVDEETEGTEEGEGTEENTTDESETTDEEKVVSNHFEITTLFIGGSEVKSQLAALTEKLEYYDIKYELDGGHFAESAEIAYEFKVGVGLEKLPIAFKDNFRFDHWEYLPEGATEKTPISSIPVERAKNITLYAVWSEKAEIKFDLKGGFRSGSTVEDEVIFYLYDYDIGEELDITMLPTNIYKDGTTFVGWSFTDGGDVITENFVLQEYNTLYAIYENTVTNP